MQKLQAKGLHKWGRLQENVGTETDSEERALKFQ